MFEVHKYHGDRRTRPVHGETIIQRNLGHLHPLFSELETNAKVIVITAPHTLAQRHGPRAQTTWRRKKRYSKKFVDDHKGQYDAEWPDGLVDRFDTVVLDEAHSIKNEDTEINLTISWLHADFHIFLSATPLLAGARDFKGFLALIEPRNAAELWSSESLTAMGLDADVNPFVLPPDHPGCILRATLKACNTFIFKYDITPTVAGYRMRKVWELCLIRRTYASHVPFSNQLTIGDALPKVHTSVYETAFNPAEQLQYDAIALELMPKLVRKDQKTKRTRWSFGILRKLSLACVWPDFMIFEHQVKASTMPTWIDDSLFIWRWLKYVEKAKPGFTAPAKQDKAGQLKCLCIGSPKLRLLLKDLADHAVRDERKHLIWCTYPADQLFIYGALRLANVDALLFSAALNADRRQAMIDRFNKVEKETSVMVATYSMGSVGLNLQKNCWHVIMFDPPPNIPIGVHAVGRVRRLGNPSPVVHVHEYFLKNSFNDRLNELNIRKMLPSVMAELNERLVSQGGEASDGGVYDEDAEVVDLGDWVILDGKLVKASSAEVSHLRLPLLKPEEILRHILGLTKGPHIRES